MSGPIEVTGSGGEVEIHSVSGTVKLSPSALESMKIKTVSGDIHIKLPSAPDATLRLHTVSGHLNGEGRTLGRREKVFGKGSKEIDVHTVSGSVETEPTS